MKVTYENGLHLPEVDLTLDARVSRCFNFISHAHSDHIHRHDQVLCSAGTRDLLRHRLGRVHAVTLEDGEALLSGAWELRLFPSGHCLGSSQIVVEGERRLVYTGDFKLRPNLCGQQSSVHQCDILVIEATYGRPHYVFPPQEEVVEKFLSYVGKALHAGHVPVVLAYSLGKSQEALKILTERGYPVALHRTVFDIARIYEAHGVEFGPYQLLSPGSESGRVLIVPPNVRRTPAIQSIERKKIIYLTGWALDRSSLYRYRADAVFPFSDHADFSELVRYAEASNARKVYTVHGFPDLAYHLRDRGIDARPLGCH